MNHMFHFNFSSGHFQRELCPHGAAMRPHRSLSRSIGTMRLPGAVASLCSLACGAHGSLTGLAENGSTPAPSRTHVGYFGAERKAKEEER